MDEVSAAALLFDAYRSFYQQPSSLQAAFDFLEQRISKNESVLFLAVLKGEAVGFVQLYPIFSSVQMKAALLLNDLYVTETARRQGVGEALLQQAKQFGRESNAAFLLLQTADDNYRAQSVYEKSGWIRTPDFFYEYPL
ncbi:MAG: GNAT family N-acetyltransferase [Chitinophagaceae bacterium]|nr:GNAT family N-acetyltransferase [Chitinophagaceae bacterium]